MADASGKLADIPTVKAGGMLWTIGALLFFATTVNYMDRYRNRISLNGESRL